MPRQSPPSALPALSRRLGALVAAAVAIQLVIALPQAAATPDPDKGNKHDDLAAAEVGSLEAAYVAPTPAEPVVVAPAPAPAPEPAVAPASASPRKGSGGTVTTTAAAPVPAAPVDGLGAADDIGNRCKVHDPEGWNKAGKKPKKPKKPKPNCPDTVTEVEPPPTTGPPALGQQPVTPTNPGAGALPTSDAPAAPDGGAAPGAGAGGGGAGGSGDGDGDGAVTVPPTEQALPPAASDRDLRSGRERVIDATRSFTALFVLAALVGGFLLLQGRLTRRDPRLIEAPVDGDYLHFE